MFAINITTGEQTLTLLPSPPKKRRVTFGSSSDVDAESSSSLVSSTRSVETSFEFPSDCDSEKDN